MSKVVVLGSINIDLVMETPRFPQIGETILGEKMDYYMGGKGANQAVACARMDAEVAMLGAGGTDAFGQQAVEHLKKEKLAVEMIQRVNDEPTGTAAIFRIGHDNAIVVLPGANRALTDCSELDTLLTAGDILLVQLEIPLATVAAGLTIAKKKQAITILNPAPFAELSAFIDQVDYLTPNETEFAELAQVAITDENIEAEMLRWSQKQRTKLIVTRGAAGVSYVEQDRVVTMPTIAVDAVDTTGAGDTFNGLLAAFLAEYPLAEAIKRASIGASLSTTKIGAQTGMPTRAEIEQHPALF